MSRRVASQSIGIVGCSAEGAALCYRTICAEGEAAFGPHGHPEVMLHGHSPADYVACLNAGDWAGIGALMLSSAEKLAAAGAAFLICPDNTIHQAMPWVQPRSPLPWLSIAEVVAAEAERRGYRCLGITGTRWLTASEIYPQALAARGLDHRRPSEAEQAEIGRLIMDELVRGLVTPEALASCRGVITRLAEAGCDAVILGCTELPLLLDDRNSPLPTLDSTRLLAQAALRRACAP
ncbi:MULTISPECIES: aspartate/glutamate racemase family protein [Methylobacterium]|uniref:aspartate/glutamate racemase family protein n=1 Tax=Methylobacterium TaxID=407 RepID=UPI0013EE0A0A|nr:amino acid racemase [Methylobacterium sp. DB0501]NGM36760.1 amino acid racemase [Methylobacterium sp. DB0501]